MHICFSEVKNRLWTGKVETTAVCSLLESFLKTKVCVFWKDNFYGNAYEIFQCVQMVLARKELVKYTDEMQAMSELVEVWIWGNSLVAVFGLSHQLKSLQPAPQSSSLYCVGELLYACKKLLSKMWSPPLLVQLCIQHPFLVKEWGHNVY